ncbi:MAG: hypothetical protein QOJ64_495 [Acidobacteriota bacterium]|nr:hypothetical protein [Acidobacteriota bacterium]
MEPSGRPCSIPALDLLELEAMKGVEPLSTGLQDRRSDIQLSYIAEVILVEPEGVEPSRPGCKAGIIPLDHGPKIRKQVAGAGGRNRSQRLFPVLPAPASCRLVIGCGGGSRTRTHSLMRRPL